MNYQPILFLEEMVKAILEGRKTQTRQVIKPQPIRGDFLMAWDWPHGRCLFANEQGEPQSEIHCHYGHPGDRLWVKETWGAVSKTEYPAPVEECLIEYRADLPIGCTDYPGQWPKEDARGCEDAPKWRSSRFMPRWASRITLEIVKVRVERVQQIKPLDAVSEGMDPDRHSIIEFRNSWNFINIKRGFGWDINPWVWIIEFQKI
jgi:hypothetical protein